MSTRTVHKYPLGGYDQRTISLPRGAEVLTVQPQDNVLQLWALVDPTQPFETREVRVHGTGHWIAEDVPPYLTTCQLPDWGLVLHIFIARTGGQP